MSKFNAAPKRGARKTTNLAGGPAYSLDKRIDLFSAVVTTFLQDKFYESAAERMERIRELAEANDPEFVAKVGVWARTEGNMRSAPAFLTAVLAQVHNGDNLVRRMVKRVCNRVDDMTEILAAYQTINDKDAPLSKQLVKGIADSFQKFDEYQFSKYNRDGAWRLKDALFISRPRAKDKAQKKLFDKIAQDALKTAKTWETSLTATGEEMKEASEQEKLEAKGNTWAKLLEEEKLGHMALLRNLRNILDTITEKGLIAKAAALLSDEKSVRYGKQFPFRYLAAYNEIENHSNQYTSLLLDAIEDAIEIAAENVPGFEKNTSVFIANDVSGSMQRPVSDKSKIRASDVGLILGTMLRSQCKDVQIGIFADYFKPVSTSSRGGIIGNCKAIGKQAWNIGWGTNGADAVSYLVKNKHKVDKVLLITDCQLWMESDDGDLPLAWREYQTEVNPDAKLYIIDVAGYGNAPIKVLRKDVVYVAGWSEKVFKLLDMIDNGEKLVDEICKIEL